MDCQTARLLLPYLNPRAESLPSELAQVVESHVGQCESCSTVLQNTGRVDRLIAVAMKDVQIPDGLRLRLVNRIRIERAKRRTWPMRHPRWSVAAAILLFCMGGVFGYWLQMPLPLDLPAFVDYNNQAGYPEQLDNLLAGRPYSHPKLFRDQYLISSAMELFQGRLVPRFTYQGPAGQIAEIYILRSKDFILAPTIGLPAGSGNFTVDLIPAADTPHGSVAYLVRYNGDSRDWLMVKGGAGA